MTVSEWLDKAKKLLDICNYEISIRNGKKALTVSQSDTLHELQDEIGYRHGIAPVSYNDASDILIEMIGMVKAGWKTPPLIPG